jgi:hypothetical protein
MDLRREPFGRLALLNKTEARAVSDLVASPWESS